MQLIRRGSYRLNSFHDGPLSISPIAQNRRRGGTKLSEGRRSRKDRRFVPLGPFTATADNRWVGWTMWSIGVCEVQHSGRRDTGRGYTSSMLGSLKCALFLVT
jgi:hypothetical protein